MLRKDQNGAPLAMYPSVGSAVTGGDALQAPLAMYPFGIKEGPNGTSLAMHPSVGFAFQARGYVSKGRRFLSDAPSGRFPQSLARRLPKICGGLFSFIFLLSFYQKTSVSVDLSHS